MEPKRYLSNDFSKMVELDTGTYQVWELHWLQFEISGHGLFANPGALAQVIARHVYEAVKKAREEGTALEYLGFQAQRVGDKLDGCLVFGEPGTYRKIAEAGADYSMYGHPPREAMKTMEVN